MSQAAYQKVVNIRKATSTSTADYSEAPANSFSLNLPASLLDKTDFTSTGFISRIQGLKDYSLSGDFNFSATKAPLSDIRDAWLNDKALDFQYLPDGSKGFSGEVRPESLSYDGDVSSLEIVSVTLQGTGVVLSTV